MQAFVSGMYRVGLLDQICPSTPLYSTPSMSASWPGTGVCLWHGSLVGLHSPP